MDELLCKYVSHYLFSDAQVANPGSRSFIDHDMVMRHFGGGIGHLQSTNHVLKGEQAVSETASISEDEDMGGSLDDNPMELGTVSHSSANEDSESELDTDDNGYDLL